MNFWDLVSPYITATSISGWHSCAALVKEREDWHRNARRQQLVDRVEVLSKLLQSKIFNFHEDNLKFKHVSSHRARYMGAWQKSPSPAEYWMGKLT